MKGFTHTGKGMNAVFPPDRDGRVAVKAHYRNGGKVHPDEAEDKKLIARELAKRGLKGGGKVKC